MQTKYGDIEYSNIMYSLPRLSSALLPTPHLHKHFPAGPPVVPGMTATPIQGTLKKVCKSTKIDNVTLLEKRQA